MGQALDAGSRPFASRQTFELLSEGAYTSSHILLGYSRNRQLAGLGGAYEYRIFDKRFGSLSYRAEILPVMFESDPYARTVSAFITPLNGTSAPPTYETRSKTIAKCQSGQFVYVIDSQTQIIGDTTCGRQRTFGQAFNPIGFRYGFRTHHKLQPFVVGTLGYMYSNRPIPVEDAGSFNFAFGVGAGVEWFSRPRRSLSVQYVLHHFSNNYSATGNNGVSAPGNACSVTGVTSSSGISSCGGTNPGVDNLLLKVSYRFGR